jgi:hypothetical protein
LRETHTPGVASPHPSPSQIPLWQSAAVLQAAPSAARLAPPPPPVQAVREENRRFGQDPEEKKVLPSHPQ